MVVGYIVDVTIRFGILVGGVVGADGKDDGCAVLK
jgi:hypothetical protein